MAWFTAPVAFVDGSILTASDLNTTVTTIRDGTVTVAHGGTGIAVGTSGGIPYFATTTTIATSNALTANGVVLGGGVGAAPAATAAGSANQVLRVPGAGGAPAFGQVDLAQSAAVTGVLPVANGGTALASGTSGGILGYTAAGTLASSVALTAGALVLGGGAGATPTTLALGTGLQVLRMNAGGTAHEYAAAAAGALTLVGSSTTEATTTATVQTDIVTIASLNIAAATPILIVLNYRKTAGAAAASSLGLKLNTTVVMSGNTATGSANQAETGSMFLYIGPRVTNYLRCVFGNMETAQTAGTLRTIQFNADAPTAAITDIVIRANSGDAAVTTGVDEVFIYTLATS